MFDIGWGELMLIGIVALIAIGPKELPGALRTLGHWMTKIRHMASEFQGQFQEAMREAELHELRKEVDEMAEKAANYTNFDPIEDIRKDIEKAADLPDLDAPVSSEPAAMGTSPSTSPTDPASLPAPASDEAVAEQAAQAEAAPQPIIEQALSPTDAGATGEGAAKPDAGKAA